MADLTRHEQFLNHIAHPDEPAPDPKTREEYILKEIADNKGGGGELPAVTAADNGKVLGVVDGAWAPDSKGYSVSESIIIAEQTLTPEDGGEIYYASSAAVIPNIGDSVEVTFNGTTYNLTVTDDQGAQQIGEGTEDEPSFDNYPFFISFYYDENEIEMADIYTETADDYTIKVESKTVTVSDDFKAAVEASGGGGGGGGVFVVDAEMDMQTGSTTFNKTWQEIYEAMASGTAAYVKSIVETEYTNTVSFSPIIAAITSRGAYLVGAIAADTSAGGTGVSVLMATATSADGYPVIQAQG